MNKNNVGLAVGSFAALVHIVWLVLVGLGVAGQAISLVLGMHLIKSAPVVLAFNWGTAVGLVILAFVVGYVAGYIFTAILAAFSKKGKK